MRCLYDSAGADEVRLVGSSPVEFGPYRVRTARQHFESVNLAIKADVDVLATVRWGVGPGNPDSAVDQFSFSRNVGHHMRLTVRGDVFVLVLESRAKARKPLHLVLTAHDTPAPVESVQLEADGGKLSVTPTGRLLVADTPLEPSESGVEIHARSAAKGTVPVAVTDGGALLTHSVAAVDPPSMPDVLKAVRAVSERLDASQRQELAALADLGEAVLGLLAEQQKTNQLLMRLVEK